MRAGAYRDRGLLVQSRQHRANNGAQFGFGVTGAQRRKRSGEGVHQKMRQGLGGVLRDGGRFGPRGVEIFRDRQ